MNAPLRVPTNARTPLISTSARPASQYSCARPRGIRLSPRREIIAGSRDGRRVVRAADPACRSRGAPRTRRARAARARRRVEEASVATAKNSAGETPPYGSSGGRGIPSRSAAYASVHTSTQRASCSFVSSGGVPSVMSSSMSSLCANSWNTTLRPWPGLRAASSASSHAMRIAPRRSCASPNTGTTPSVTVPRTGPAYVPRLRIVVGYTMIALDLAVVVGVERQDEQRRLDRDRRPDVVVEREAVRGFPVLVPQEPVAEGAQLFAFVGTGSRSTLRDARRRCVPSRRTVPCGGGTRHRFELGVERVAGCDACWVDRRVWDDRVQQRRATEVEHVEHRIGGRVAAGERRQPETRLDEPQDRRVVVDDVRDVVRLRVRRDDRRRARGRRSG